MNCVTGSLSFKVIELVFIFTLFTVVHTSPFTTKQFPDHHSYSLPNLTSDVDCTILSRSNIS